MNFKNHITAPKNPRTFKNAPESMGYFFWGKTTDPLALSEQLKTELKAYQAWQVAMEQKKRDLAFAELQLNWLKKQVEIAQQQKLLA